MVREPDDEDPLAPVRCLGCGAVNAEWRRLGAGAIFASSAIVAGWGFWLRWSIGTSVWWLPFVGAVGLAAAFDRISRRFGVPECRYCGDQRTESGEWLCEAHGPVRRTLVVSWTFFPSLLVPGAMIRFALQRINGPSGAFGIPELALSGVAVGLAAVIFLESRRRAYRSISDGQRCRCSSVVPSWTEKGRAIAARLEARVEGCPEAGEPSPPGEA